MGSSLLVKKLLQNLMQCGVDDGFGGFNRTVVVGYDDVITPLVCFCSCEICGFVPDLFADVTFRVDLFNQTLSSKWSKNSRGFSRVGPLGHTHD